MKKSTQKINRVSIYKESQKTQKMFRKFYSLLQNITYNMINKIVGYSGFQSYGELHYPTRKQGKDLQLQNKVWQDTRRQADQQKPLENYHNAKTIYKNTFLQNTHPEHYHPEHVVKGQHKTLDFSKAATIKAYDTQQAEKFNQSSKKIYDQDQNVDSIDKAKQILLKSGTEHWKSNYQATNQDYRLGKTMAPDNWQTQKNSYIPMKTDANLTDGWRSQSLNAKKFEQESKKNSYKNRAYINNNKMGITDYKFNYGEKIGSSPMDLMNGISYKQPLRDNPLKRGTNQLWTQIPNYQGFKPSELHFKDYQKKIQNRNGVDKGDKKLNLAQNYHVQVPGYCGYKPKFQTTSNKLRQSCFSSK